MSRKIVRNAVVSDFRIELMICCCVCQSVRQFIELELCVGGDDINSNGFVNLVPKLVLEVGVADAGRFRIDDVPAVGGVGPETDWKVWKMSMRKAERAEDGKALSKVVGNRVERNG